MQTSYCIRIGIPPFKVVSPLPTEHSLSFQAWSSLPKCRWIVSVPQIQMRYLCLLSLYSSDNTPVWSWTANGDSNLSVMVDTLKIIPNDFITLERIVERTEMNGFSCRCTINSETCTSFKGNWVKPPWSVRN